MIEVMFKIVEDSRNWQTEYYGCRETLQNTSNFYIALYAKVAVISVILSLQKSRRRREGEGRGGL